MGRTEHLGTLGVAAGNGAWRCSGRGHCPGGAPAVAAAASPAPPGPPQHQSCTGHLHSLGRKALSKEATTVRSADLIRGLMRKCLWTGLPE